MFSTAVVCGVTENCWLVPMSANSVSTPAPPLMLSPDCNVLLLSKMKALKVSLPAVPVMLSRPSVKLKLVADGRSPRGESTVPGVEE